MTKMISSIRYISVYQFFLGVCSFLLCFAPKLAPIGLILIFITAIFGVFKQKSKFVAPNKMMVAFMLLYFTYLIGVLFTDNLPIALNYLEYKLAFVLIPIIFFIRPREVIGLSSVSIGLIIGVILTMASSLISGIQCYNEIDYFLECFTSSYLTKEHPTYFAVYLTLSIALSWFGWKNKFRFFRTPVVVLYNILAVLMLVLGLSLSGILFALLTAGIVTLILINKRWGRLASLSILLAAPLIILVLFFSVPSLKKDISNSISTMNSFFQDSGKFLKFNGEHSGDDVRLIMWAVTFQEILEHPFGVGTGNVDSYLSKRLKSYDQVEMAKMDDNRQILYNPHNQFLQTGLEIGIIGLLLLLFIIVYGIVRGIKTNNWLLILLSANLAFNCLFESMLQRQSGLVFYTFWLILLSISYVKVETTKSKIENE